jgi:hypothetical protein
MVESSLVDQIIRVLPPDEVYEKLVLVVGQPNSGRTEALETLAKQKSIPLIRVGPALSERLLEIPATRRPQKVLDCMRQILGEGSAPCILNRIELLFAPELNQNPLSLLQLLSRERILVVAWSGRMREG